MKNKKKQGKVIRNIKYFVPLLLKVSPITIPMMILTAILNSVSSFIYIIIPAQIIEELIGDKDIVTVLIYVGIFVITNFLIRVLNNLFFSIISYTAMRTDFIIDEMMNKKIMEVDYFNIEDPTFIDSMHRAKKGMTQYTSGIYSFIYTLQQIIYCLITVFGVIGIIIASKQYLVIFVAVIGIISNTLIYQKVQTNDQRFRNDMARGFRKAYYYNTNIASFRLQKELRLFKGKEMIKDITDVENEQMHEKCMKYAWKNGFLYFIDTSVMYFVTRFLAIITLGYAVFRPENAITVATFTMLFSAINTLDNSSTGLIYSLQDYLKSCEYQSDFINLMEKESVFKNGKKSIDSIKSVEFCNVSFKYPGTEKYILENVSFKIDNKEKVSLVGINGSGKTTMIKLLCRFYDVNSGSILVNGCDIKEYDYQQYMNHMAIVFQDYKVISFNIKSNVSIVEENDEKLYDCFKRAQVYDRVMSLPNKENTYINKWFDKAGVEFSGGEMQKFALSRALYKDCDFVILDEPTSALDPLAEAEIYYHFNDVVGKKLAMFISHRLSSCIFSDRILVIDGARIIEEGKHDELMKNPDGIYFKMFSAQSEYYK